MPVAWPANEEARLAAVAALAWPAANDDARLDDIVALAADALAAPIAFISLTEERHQVAIASVGAARISAPREATFCNHTIAAGAMLVALDATEDPRFAANPFVTNAPGVRFYAGAPLWSDEGFCLGTLCVLDTVARTEFSARDRETLARLARLAERRLQEGNLRARTEAAEAARATAEARTRGMLSEAASAFAACDRLAINLGGRARAALTRARRASERGGGHVLDNELSALSDLVSELIEVARLDRASSAAPALMQPSALMRAIIADCAPIAAKRGVSIGFNDMTAGVEMVCDPWRLEDLLDTLIDDCLALSRTSLSISCGLERGESDGRTRLAIRVSSANDGPPWRISAHSRELVDCLAGWWELDQAGRSIAVLLPARLSAVNASLTEPNETPTNVIPFRAKREGKA